MDKDWLLEGKDSKGKPWIINIEEYPFYIGRGSDAQLRLPNPGISRKHICIEKRKDELFIEDLKSTNGSLLNDIQLTEKKRFLEGDKITLCDYEFKLALSSEDDDRTIITNGSSNAELFREKYKLTPRESELLSYLIKGISTKEIAASMFISTGTAKNHILNLLKKTNTHSRLELITHYKELI